MHGTAAEKVYASPGSAPVSACVQEGVPTASTRGVHVAFTDTRLALNNASFGSGGVLFLRFTAYDTTTATASTSSGSGSGSTFTPVNVTINFDNVDAVSNRASGAGGVLCLVGGRNAQVVSVRVRGGCMRTNRAGHGNSAQVGWIRRGVWDASVGAGTGAVTT